MSYFENSEKEKLDKEIIEAYQGFVGFLTSIDMGDHNDISW